MRKLVNVLREIRGLAAIVLVAVLFSITAGCGRSKPSHFYTLREVLPETKVVATDKVSTVTSNVILGVGPITVPGYIDRNKIVTRVNTAEVKLSDYYRWAEPAPDKIEYVIQENLATLCPSVDVRKYTFRTSAELTHYVKVEITEFITGTDDKVLLNARYTIFSMNPKEKPIKKVVSLEKSVNNRDYNDVVFAMSSLLGELCVDIAEAVKLLK